MDQAVEELLVGGQHLRFLIGLVVIGPRPAHDPVVQALAPDAQAAVLAGPSSGPVT